MQDSNKVILWEISKRKQLGLLSHEVSVSNLAFSPDGEYLATIDETNTVHVWNVRNVRKIRQLKHEEEILDVTFTFNSKLLFIRSSLALRVWEVTSGKELAGIAYRSDRESDLSSINSVDISPTGAYIATGGADRTVNLWNIATGEQLGKLHHDTEIKIVAYSPKGDKLAVATNGNTINVWAMEHQEEIASLSHYGTLQDMFFSPDGHHLAIQTDNRMVYLWEIASGKEIPILKRERPIEMIQFSPDAKYLATMDASTVNVLKVGTGKDVAQFKNTKPDIFERIEFSPDGAFLVATTAYSITKWRISTGKEEWNEELNAFEHCEIGYPASRFLSTLLKDQIVNLKISPDGRYLATGCDRTWFPEFFYRLWDTEDGIKYDVWGELLDFSLDSKFVGIANGSEATVFNLSENMASVTISHGASITALALSPNGDVIATAGRGGVVKLWEIHTGQLIAQINHDGWVNLLHFTPIGNKLVTATSNIDFEDYLSRSTQDIPAFRTGSNTVLIWDVSNKKTAGLLEHRNRYLAAKKIAFSPTGEFIAAANTGRTVRILDPMTGNEITRLVQNDKVTDLLFSPKGMYLAVTSGAKVTRIWRTKEWEELPKVAINGRIQAFDHNETFVATTHEEKAVVINLYGETTVVNLTHDDSIEALGFSPTGSYIWTKTNKEKVNVWETHNGMLVTYFLHDRPVAAIALIEEEKEYLKESRG